ncbi:hypothetical protein SPRG_14423 [Saprolegnia parasitica CBS 223.65]|uniref:LNR domain-containing protein n=1 Tax=Saprolegnia parasitica (strain CBS 223.65) TaxID=695850 RepID=A0A067BPV9_SAPPC|nr:hypothetical protein SPRG_14423 [Saprolegnia parasitica CBS 223.65]KDO20288.1 hypothetical protein SPRG_14423 [Saprolegnia parasitica CBS 223.65]|eukprot:XP_012209026.1 hypothetical protein SPRG_14423 [Saprolegnia parasitica CBS 223.65]
MYAKKFQRIAIASQLRNDASWLTVTSLGMRGYSSNTLPSLVCKVLLGALNLWTMQLLAQSVLQMSPRALVTPLFRDTTCYCAYAHVHCTATNDDDTDDGGVAFLQSQLAPLGTRLFYLEIDHCPLPHGVPAHVLAPLTTLYALRVLFSNMTSFDGVGLPSSLMVLELRYSALTVAPTVVTSALPPMLLSLYLDGSRIPHLGRDVIRHWRQLTTLHVTETPIGDDDFVTIVRELPHLSELALHHTQMTALPPELFRLPSLQTVFLSSCAITAWPSQPVTPLDGFLDLSCNPLTHAPSWVQVDASCEASCSSLLRTNGLCNYACDDAPACAQYFLQPSLN